MSVDEKSIQVWILQYVNFNRHGKSRKDQKRQKGYLEGWRTTRRVSLFGRLVKTYRKEKVVTLKSQMLLIDQIQWRLSTDHGHINLSEFTKWCTWKSTFYYMPRSNNFLVDKHISLSNFVFSNINFQWREADHLGEMAEN